MRSPRNRSALDVRQAARNAQPLVSATLIVRDEENYLGGCLQLLRPLIDDIVVVDTGSRDRTMHIAEEYGARVFEYVWHDDFAAARNHAIDHAVGEWILYIDADERLRDYDRRQLQHELTQSDLIACTVRFYPQTGYTAYPEYRLFRRDDRIRFRGAMHETIVPSLLRLEDAGVGRIGISNLTIDHLGYDRGQAHKLDRNLRLLQKQLSADPSRIYLWWHLGTVYHDLSRVAEAEAAWREGIRLATSSVVRLPEEGLCFVEMAKLLLGRGNDALALIETGLALQPEHYLLRWLKGRALMAAGRYAEAVEILEELAAVNADTLIADVAYDKRIFGPFAAAEIGECNFRLGRYAESHRWYSHAEAQAPESLEFRIKRQLAGARAAALRQTVA